MGLFCQWSLHIEWTSLFLFQAFHKILPIPRAQIKSWCILSLHFSLSNPPNKDLPLLLSMFSLPLPPSIWSQTHSGYMHLAHDAEDTLTSASCRMVCEDSSFTDGIKMSVQERNSESRSCRTFGKASKFPLLIFLQCWPGARHRRSTRRYLISPQVWHYISGWSQARQLTSSFII